MKKIGIEKIFKIVVVCIIAGSFILPGTAISNTDDIGSKKNYTNMGGNKEDRNQNGWWCIKQETFEGVWPNDWEVTNYGYDGSEAQWGKTNLGQGGHTSVNGCYCAKDGPDGINPPGPYRNNMETWMISAPFDLSDATDAYVRFYLWYDTQSGHDFVGCYAAINSNGPYYSSDYSSFSGRYKSWKECELDLTNIHTLGNLCGRPQVWIAFIFESDDSTAYEGAYLDDILIMRYIPDEPPVAKQWTFMAYLDADNNLESAGIDDFLEMSSSGSTDDVNIIVQFDRSEGYSTAYGDWKTTKRFLITRNMEPTPANALSDIGEAQMNNPQTLIDFVVWAVDNYPADHYCLILWDHGSGWWPRGDGDGSKGICFDDGPGSNGDGLTMIELKSAMNTIKDHLYDIQEKTLDLLDFDACLMSMMEVYYQLRDTVDIVIGSEELVPGDGLPYDTILQMLTSNPYIYSSELATLIVDNYMDYYGDDGDETIAAFYLDSLCNDLIPELNVFSNLLKENVYIHYSDILEVREHTEYFDHDGNYVFYTDLYDFTYQIWTNINDVSIQTAASNVMNDIWFSCIAEGHGNEHPNAHGLSIYWEMTEEHYNSNYGTLDFSLDTFWDDFLLRFHTDAYETDDAFGSAKVISTDGTTQFHNFHLSGDQDWVKFNGIQGETYRIETVDNGEESTPYLELYDANEWSLMSGLSICWYCLNDGTYYLKVIENWGRSGPTTHYSLEVLTTTPPLPSVVYVDDNYYDDDHDGGHDWGYDAFNNIQDGITHVGEGGTIYVYSGTFGGVLIDKTVNLFGENRESTIIDATDEGDLHEIAIIITADEVTVSGFTIENGDHGILINARDCYIQGNLIKDNDGSGIFLQNDAFHTEIIENTIQDHVGIGSAGIYVNEAVDTNITANNITRNDIGIYSQNSDNTKIKGNTIQNNIFGIDFYHQQNGYVAGNNITQNSNYGILLYYGCHGNKIFENTISYNYYGVYILTNNCNNNIIYHNDFISNTYQASDKGTNLWNTSYPSGGNYWNNYNGIDIKRGPLQNAPGNDGIIDIPYDIPGNTPMNQDKYPLVHPYITNCHGLWRFNENGGLTAYDSTACNNHGTLHGNPQWIGGFSGSALLFDGDGGDDYVKVLDDTTLDITNQITIEAWIMPYSFSGDAIGSGNAIVSKWYTWPYGSYLFYAYPNGADQSTGRLKFSLCNQITSRDLTTPDPVLTTDIWYHVAAVYNGTAMRIYVNGQEKAVVAVTLPGLSTFGDDVYIGRLRWYSSWGFDGIIDEVKIWSVARTQSQILSDMLR